MLRALAGEGALRIVGAGRCVVAELEPGEEALVVLRGTGTATVGGLGDDAPLALAEVGPGDCIGEMALFTGELRSATVTATTRMLLLAIDHARFDELLRRYPPAAARLAAVLAARHRDNQRVLATVLDPTSDDAARRGALRNADGGDARPERPRRFTAAARVAWRELVVRHRRELPFLMLGAFAATLLGVRGAIGLARRVALAPTVESLLRASYVSGVVLLCVAGTVSLLYFRPRLRRTLAILYGTGLALLVNALPVLLTFDLFYRDMVTPDPNLAFSVDVLYDRAEGANAAFVAAALLFQAVYLRRFHRRVAQLLADALRRRAAPAPPLTPPTVGT